MITDCCMRSDDNTVKILVNDLIREMQKFKEDSTARLLLQDGKIAETCVYIKENLSNYLRDIINDMDNSGELKDVITDILLAGIISEIEQTEPYYDGITTSKIFDTVSSTYYYLTTIPKKDKDGKPIRFKMGIANDDKTCSSLESTLKHAWRKNATICVNCGVWNVETTRPVASVIYEGEILYKDIPTTTPEKYQYFTINHKNEIKTYPIGTTPEKMVEDGVYYACPIFATLLNGGAPVTQTDKRKEPRQSIGVTAKGDIVIISCDGRNHESSGMSYDDLARLHALNGSVNAYIFDGGGSTSTVLRGVKQNENVDNYTTDRSVGTFFYVAKDTTVADLNNPGNNLGRVKQFLIGQIRAKTDFPLGRISLRAGEGSYFPTMEMYVDGEETRRSRITLSYDPANQRNTYLYISLKGVEDATEKTNLFRIYPQGVWIQTYHGTSSQRPAGLVGMPYFDETLNKPIWYTGTQWVDATGTKV